MLGKSLKDPYKHESKKKLNAFSYLGLDLLPLRTTFLERKNT